MIVVIAAATQFEIQPVINFLRGKDFKLGDHTIEILITGVGMMAATYSLTRFVLQQNPGYLVQAGIAGTFTNELLPGNVVLIREEIIGDLGAAEDNGFRDLFDLGLLTPSATPFVHGRLPNPFAASFRLVPLPLVSGVTVNEITTSQERIKLLREKYACDIESMEGAAFHYVCLLHDLPFLQLRAVSNFIGDRNKKNWKMQEAIENLNTSLIKIIQQITSQ